MSERLRSIDEKGIWEKIGAVLPGILGWAATLKKEIEKNDESDEEVYASKK